MKMQKRQFRIGELAQYLDVEKFVIRFWEKEFEMRCSRSTGGQRFYDDKDIEKFSTIKDLLYKKGYTIAGAKQQLKERSKRKTSQEDSKVMGSHKTTIDAHNAEQPSREQLSNPGKAAAPSPSEFDRPMCAAAGAVPFPQDQPSRYG